MALIAKKWLHLPWPREHAEVRLICLHHAGGNTAMFAPWARAVDSRIEVCAVHLPGRGVRVRERPCQRLLPLLDQLEELWPIMVDRPVAFFGHSMGALLAYLLLARRREGTEEVRQLFVSSFLAPHRRRNAKPLADLSDGALIDEIVALDPEFAEITHEPELLRLSLPAIRADFALVEQFQPTEIDPLDVPIFALGGDRDRRVHMGELMHWKDHTSAAFRARVFAGGHFYLRQNSQQVLDTIEGVVLTPTRRLSTNPRDGNGAAVFSAEQPRQLLALREEGV